MEVIELSFATALKNANTFEVMLSICLSLPDTIFFFTGVIIMKVIVEYIWHKDWHVGVSGEVKSCYCVSKFLRTCS